MVRAVYVLRFPKLHQTVHMAGVTSVRTQISLSIADTCSQTIRQPCGLPQLSRGLSFALRKPALVTRSIRKFSLSPAMHIHFLKQRSHRKVPHCSHHWHCSDGEGWPLSPWYLPCTEAGKKPCSWTPHLTLPPEPQCMLLCLMFLSTALLFTALRHESMWRDQYLKAHTVTLLPWCFSFSFLRAD